MTEYFVHPVLKEITLLIKDQLEDSCDARKRLHFGFVMCLIVIFLFLCLIWKAFLNHTFTSVKIIN